MSKGVFPYAIIYSTILSPTQIIYSWIVIKEKNLYFCTVKYSVPDNNCTEIYYLSLSDAIIDYDENIILIRHEFVNVT